MHSQQDLGGKGRDLGARHSGFHVLLKLSKILTSEYAEGLLRKDKSVRAFIHLRQPEQSQHVQSAT